MKLLFVALGVYTGVGGIERFNQRVVRCLSELGLLSGLESRVIVLWDPGECRHQAPERVGFSPGARSKLRTAAAFAWHVRRMRPDVILYGHILLAPLAGVARLLSPRSRNLLFVHGRDVWLEPFRSRIPLWELFAVRTLVDRVVSVSHLTTERMKRAYGIPGYCFRVLPNAVDVAPGDASGCRDHRSQEPRLLTVTRLGPNDHSKGCDRVIRALPAILSAFPNTHYDLVGDGPLKSELHRLAKELGIDSHVHFLGYVEDRQLDEIYRRSHLLVMPSVGEGFGIVFLEAWKHNLPVVVGNQDASAEVVTHGFNGLCVDPYSVEEIAESVAELLKDTDRAARMGQNGLQTVLDRYTHGHFRQRLVEILQEN